MKDQDSKLLWEAYGSKKPLPHEEDFEYGGHTGEQRINSAEKQAYVVADSQGVYGVYTTMQGAAGARDEIGGGSYVVGVSVDVDPQQYDEISDMDLNPDQLEESLVATNLMQIQEHFSVTVHLHHTWMTDSS